MNRKGRLQTPAAAESRCCEPWRLQAATPFERSRIDRLEHSGFSRRVMSDVTAAEGFAMPPEWSPQEAVWLSWPVDDARHWGGAKRDLIWAKFAQITAAITRHEPARINAPSGDHPAILAACNRAKAVPERVELFDHHPPFPRPPVLS